MCYTIRQYENRIMKLDSLKKQIEALQAEADKITADIKADMADNERVEADNFKISWLKVISSRFDTTSFKAEHQLLYSQYLKQTETRRFTYSLR